MDGWSYPGLESLIFGVIFVVAFGLFGAGILRVLFSPRWSERNDRDRNQSSE
jgi:hypothetical protein